MDSGRKIIQKKWSPFHVFIEPKDIIYQVTNVDLVKCSGTTHLKKLKLSYMHECVLHRIFCIEKCLHLKSKERTALFVERSGASKITAFLMFSQKFFLEAFCGLFLEKIAHSVLLF